MYKSPKGGFIHRMFGDLFVIHHSPVVPFNAMELHENINDGFISKVAPRAPSNDTFAMSKRQLTFIRLTRISLISKYVFTGLLAS